MKVGIAFDLVPESPSAAKPAGGLDDHFEEFDKPETIEAIAAVLRSRGHEVIKLGDGRALIERVLLDPPDLVWNMAEGEGIGRCREARVPAFLEMLGIPYTGSDPLTLAATLDKDVAKRIVSSEGTVRVPFGRALPPDTAAEDLLDQAGDLLRRGPVLLKPSFEGSSKGIHAKCLVESRNKLVDTFAELARGYGQTILVEEFIKGEELTVGITGNGESARVLGAMRVVPRQAEPNFVYSLEVKRDWRARVIYEAPPRLDPTELEALNLAAIQAYQILGCRDLARIDFRLRDGVPCFIEANPLPGLTPGTSDLVILAEGYGIDHASLINRIFDAGLVRLGMTDR